jgi:hypothetical protein
MGSNNSFLMQQMVHNGQAPGPAATANQLAAARGSLNEQQLLAHQQNLIKQAGQLQQQQQSDSQSGKGNHPGMSSQMNTDSAAFQSIQSQQQSSSGSSNNMSQQMHSQQQNPHSQQQEASISTNESTMRSMQASMSMPTPMQNTNTQSGPDQNSSNKSFLDGRFAGGWQSNNDLPDRRKVIFSILEVIQQMRPETTNLSEK